MPEAAAHSGEGTHQEQEVLEAEEDQEEALVAGAAEEEDRLEIAKITRTSLQASSFVRLSHVRILEQRSPMTCLSVL